VAPEVARVVVGDQPLDGRDRSQPALGDEAAQQLGVVHDLEVAAHLRVLVGEGVEAVRAGRDDLALRRGSVAERLAEDLDVLLGLHLEEELVAQPPRRVAGARLALGQDHELDAGGVEQLREGLGGLLGAVLQGTGTADPVEVLDVCRDRVLAVGPEDADREVALLDPGVAGGGGRPHGLPLFSTFLSIVPASLGKLDSMRTW
jgi:hypothetical protein